MHSFLGLTTTELLSMGLTCIEEVTKIELIHYVLVYSLDESEEDEVAPPLSKRRRAAGREAEGREPIEEVSNDLL